MANLGRLWDTGTWNVTPTPPGDNEVNVNRRRLIPDLPPSAREAVDVVAKLHESGHAAYLVGGAVRDLLRGATPGDWDVVTDARPERITELFPGSRQVGAAFGVVLVPRGGSWIETATFREDGLYLDGRHPEDVRFTDNPDLDARRRDFTVNALLLDPMIGEVLDPVGGLADLEAGLLRAVGRPDERFAEDGLRVLRAARLAAQCGFTIEHETSLALARNAAVVERLAAERIAGELERIVCGPRPSLAFDILRTSGVLGRFLPEVDALFGVAQPPDHHPEGCVWTHTMLLLDTMEAGSPLELALAGLLHDIGKPATRIVRDGVPRFPGHAAAGARMADAVLTRLRFSNRMIGVVTSLVGRHMMFLDVAAMRPATLKRFLSHPHFPLLHELHRLDRLAGRRDLSTWEYCRDALAAIPPHELRPEPLISGRDLIRLGYPRGPLLGVILENVETAQLEGELLDREAVLAWVSDRYPRG